MSGKLTDQQKIDIVREYSENEKMTIAELGRKYGINDGSINKILRKRGVIIRNDYAALTRKYTLDENVFEKIDSEEKAYFLGFLYADGCNNVENNYITLGLQEKDKHILYRYADLLKTNKPLRLRKEKKSKQDMFVMDIFSKKISHDLIKLGCLPRKTFTLKFPTEDQVPRIFLRHFMRGIWDGDGGYDIRYSMVGKYGPYLKVCAKITSTDHVCSNIKELLEKQFNIYSAIRFHANKITKILSVESVNGFYRLCKWFYRDSTIYLERKYKKYLEFLELAKGKYDDRWDF